MNNIDKIEIVSAHTLAEMLDITPETLSRWAKAGKIPYLVLPSGRKAYNIQEVTTTLEKNAGRKKAALSKGKRTSKNVYNVTNRAASKT